METNRSKRYALFALGAALGSAFGLILGSLLTFWIGEGTLRAIQRGLRRLLLRGHVDGSRIDEFRKSGGEQLVRSDALHDYFRQGPATALMVSISAYTSPDLRRFQISPVHSPVRTNSSHMAA